MSIIRDALEKAEIQPWSARRKFSVKKPAIFLLFFVMLGLSFFLYQSLTEKELIAEKKPAEAVPEREEIPVAAEEKASPSQVTDVMHLTGIMYTPKKPLAVVNGGVWAEGEYIGKYRIQEIGRDFLKINLDGRESVIKLER